MAIVGKVGSESSEPLKAYHIGFENTEDTLATTSSSIGSEKTDPRKAHQTTIFSRMGFRIDPLKLSESIGCNLLTNVASAYILFTIICKYGRE